MLIIVKTFAHFRLTFFFFQIINPLVIKCLSVNLIVTTFSKSGQCGTLQAPPGEKLGIN